MSPVQHRVTFLFQTLRDVARRDVARRDVARRNVARRDVARHDVARRIASRRRQIFLVFFVILLSTFLILVSKLQFMQILC